MCSHLHSMHIYVRHAQVLPLVTHGHLMAAKHANTSQPSGSRGPKSSQWDSLVSSIVPWHDSKWCCCYLQDSSLLQVTPAARQSPGERVVGEIAACRRAKIAGSVQVRRTPGRDCLG